MELSPGEDRATATVNRYASICLLATSRHSIEMTDQAGFTYYKENSGIYKNKGTSLWNFVLNSGLRKCRHGTSIVA